MNKRQYKKLIKKMTEYCVELVQSEAGDLSNGLNYINDMYYLERRFKIKLTDKVQEDLLESLQCHEAVADVQFYDECIDIVIYTSYAPNYEPEEEY